LRALATLWTVIDQIFLSQSTFSEIGDINQTVQVRWDRSFVLQMHVYIMIINMFWCYKVQHLLLSQLTGELVIW